MRLICINMSEEADPVRAGGPQMVMIIVRKRSLCVQIGRNCLAKFALRVNPKIIFILFLRKR